MPDTPPIRAAIGLPPDETVRAFRARDELRTTVRWSEAWHEDHARAFTVAKVAQVDLLATIRASLDKVLSEGGTFEQWKAGLIPELQSAGWWGRIEDKAITGTSRPVLVGARRLRTIYDTNLRMSRAAGQWKRIQALKTVRPFLMYVAVGDRRTRPMHRRWGGLDPMMPIRIILPVDHPCWAIYYPPNDWGCRCTVRQLSQRDLDRNGWAVTTDAELRRVGWLTADGDPGGNPRGFYRAGSKKPVAVPGGIGPGFAYNPGAASLGVVAAKAAASLEVLAATDLVASRAALESLTSSGALDAFVADPAGAFPIGILDDATAAMLQAPSRVLVLPERVVAKQDRRHAELTIDDYRRLPGIIADPLVVIDQGGNKVIFYAQRGTGRFYKLVLRTDAGQPRSALVSFHIARPRDIDSEARRGSVVIDRRPT